jgi:predicted dehydrogenase
LSTPSVETIGIGIVGLGFGAAVHLPGYKLLDGLGVRVTALCARDVGAANEIARRHGVPRAYTEWRDLVEDPGVDLVSVATPPKAHAEVALGALEARKAVFCEKPLATSLAGARELADAADRAGCPTAVNFSYRAVPAFRRAREVLSRRELGDVLHVQVDWHVPSRLDPEAPWSWKDDAEAGGGALASYGIHALDYLEWLVGPAVRVFGRLTTFSTARINPHGDERIVSSDDVCTILLELEPGGVATITISTASAGGRLHRVDVRCRHGRLVLENNHDSDPIRPFGVRVAEGDGELETLPLDSPMYPAPGGIDPRVEPFAAHAAGLVEALRNNSEYRPSFADGLRAQRLLDGVRASAANGCWFDLVGPTTTRGSR